MKTYPINLNIVGKRCVVVGGGEVALRKIRGLLEAGAIVKVIAPEICAGVEELFQRGEIFLTRENFSPDMLDDELILIAATDNPAVNRLPVTSEGNIDISFLRTVSPQLSIRRGGGNQQRQHQQHRCPSSDHKQSFPPQESRYSGLLYHISGK